MHLKNGTNELHFYYGSDGKPAFVRMGVDWYAYVYNLQGDVIALTNNSGSVVVAYSYDAWGKPLGVTGTLAATLGRLNPFRYRGYVWDEETGLYYLQTRYYSSAFCRFLSEDEFYGNNLYSYCDCNPVSNADLNGCTCTAAEKSRNHVADGICDHRTLKAALCIMVALVLCELFEANKAQQEQEQVNIEYINHRDWNKTVKEILKTKKGSIKQAPMKPGGPHWDDILEMTLAEIHAMRQIDYRWNEIYKLLNDGRFNK